MTENHRELSSKCFEAEDYPGYLRHAKLQYEKSKDPEDKELYDRAVKECATYEEIQAIINSDHNDYYAILGISKNASIKEIKEAFRIKASRCHPNRTRVHGATHATRIINKAYFEINTEEKKATYDAKRRFPKMINSIINSDALRQEAPLGHAHASFTFSAPGFRFSAGFPSGNPFIEDSETFEVLYRTLYSQTRLRARHQEAHPFPTYVIYVLIIFVIVLSII